MKKIKGKVEIIDIYEKTEETFWKLQEEKETYEKIKLLIVYLQNYKLFITKLPKAPVEELKNLKELILKLYKVEEVDELLDFIDKNILKCGEVIE